MRFVFQGKLALCVIHTLTVCDRACMRLVRLSWYVHVGVAQWAPRRPLVIWAVRGLEGGPMCRGTETAQSEPVCWGTEALCGGTVCWGTEAAKDMTVCRGNETVWWACVPGH